MPVSSNYHAVSLPELLREALTTAADDLLVVDPDAETVAELVTVATARGEDLPTIRVVARERVLKEVVDDFLVASNAADLVEAGTLALRTTTDGAANSLLVSHDAVLALVPAGDHVAGLAADDREFVDAAYAEYRDRWAEGEEFTLRTPALSRVRETLAAEIGEDVRDDFDAVLETQRSVPGDGSLDEVTISLLVAARNEVLLYDISKWGEDVGIASKATFSRTKTRLEDRGIVDTEKVPIDVGRPRLRLKLGDEDLRGLSAEELAEAVGSRLD